MNGRNNPDKLFLRLLIAVVIIALCMAAYPALYCKITGIC